MSRYGKGMRDCCDSPAQAGSRHIAGCIMTPTDKTYPASERVARLPHSKMTLQEAADFINDATVNEWKSRALAAEARVAVLEKALEQAVQIVEWNSRLQRKPFSVTVAIDAFRAARTALEPKP